MITGGEISTGITDQLGQRIGRFAYPSMMRPALSKTHLHCLSTLVVLYYNTNIRAAFYSVTKVPTQISFQMKLALRAMNHHHPYTRFPLGVLVKRRWRFTTKLYTRNNKQGLLDHGYARLMTWPCSSRCTTSDGSYSWQRDTPSSYF